MRILRKSQKSEKSQKLKKKRKSQKQQQKKSVILDKKKKDILSLKENYKIMQVLFMYLKLCGMNYRQKLLEIYHNNKHCDYRYIVLQFYEYMYFDKKICFTYEVDADEEKFIPTYKYLLMFDSKIESLYQKILQGKI